MKLERVEIKNFKSLHSADFQPGDFACLVGENNAGKSSVLQAISIALKPPNELPEALFYESGQAIEMRLSFDQVTEQELARLSPEQQAKIQPRIRDEKLTIIVRYTVGNKVAIKMLSARPIEERYRDEAIDDAFRNKRGGAIMATLNEKYIEFSGDDLAFNAVGAAKEHVKQRIAQDEGTTWELVEADLPTGMSSSISNLLPEVIYIPAVKNLKDDLKTTQSTSFGRLLGLLLEDMAPDLDTINQALMDLDTLLNRRATEGGQSDNRHAKVRDYEGRIEGFLQEHFTTAKVELSIPPPELKVILNNAKIYIDDGSKDLVDEKGDGIKRSLTFAILRSYVVLLAERRLLAEEQGEGEQTRSPRPLLFLFEEPELFLHPRSQRILFDALAGISTTHQLIVTTHSPLFFAPGVTASFVRVAKEDAEPKPIGKLYPVNFVLDQERAEVFRLARFENADAAFFSRSVALFEGESDDAFFKHVAPRLNPEWNFDKKNISLVRVSGKGNFGRFRNFFESFGLRVVVVADLDAMFKDYQHLGGSDEATQLRNTAIENIDRRIQALQVVAEPNSRQIKRQTNTQSWAQRYESVRQIVRAIQASGNTTPEQIANLDELFTWETPIAREKACLEDDEARAALRPVLDNLRGSGIAVLSRGAIESYYPANTPNSSSKPARAISACDLVQTREEAVALSSPLANGREAELVEIFAMIFGSN